MTTTLKLAPAVLLALCALTQQGAQAQTQDSTVWLSLLRVTEYAASIRVGVARECRDNSPKAQSPIYRPLCPKLDVVPNGLIDAAALPFIKQHLPEDVAQRALDFWSTQTGRALAHKMVLEIATGVLDQLSEEDMALLDISNRTSYGRALLTFTSDRNCRIAVLEAMSGYAPEPDPAPPTNVPAPAKASASPRP